MAAVLTLINKLKNKFCRLAYEIPKQSIKGKSRREHWEYLVRFGVCGELGAFMLRHYLTIARMTLCLHIQIFLSQ